MRLFIYEYISAAAPFAPPSLQREGWAMLKAIVSDFQKIIGVEVVTLIGVWQAGDLHEANETIGRAWPSRDFIVTNPEVEPVIFRRLAREADYTLVIAPE